MPSTLDNNSCYWQIKAGKADREKADFTSHHGLYHLKRLLFALKNERDTFQTVMDVVLQTVKWQSALVYVGAIAIYSKTPKDHIHHARSVLRLLKDAGVVIKLKKYASFPNSIHYLRHVIKPGKLKVANHTVDAIRKIPIPTTMTNLESSL